MTSELTTIKKRKKSSEKGEKLRTFTWPFKLIVLFFLVKLAVAPMVGRV
jgi:hypothetical protein